MLLIYGVILNYVLIKGVVEFNGKIFIVMLNKLSDF